MEHNLTRRAEPAAEVEALRRLGWYHSIELPDGSVIEGVQSVPTMRSRLAQFPVPVDLRGKRILDIGAWDGWFSFELERRGASMVAVDLVPQPTFLKARELVGSQVEYWTQDVCRLSPQRSGYFDIVMFLGVLYHLKHPMLALEKICALSTDLVCVESFVSDAQNLNAAPILEFYEIDELCGQFDNWVGPNVPCLLAVCRAAGFARVRLESVIGNRAHVSCFRRWPEMPEDPGVARPYITCVENSVTRDHSFSDERDDYMTLWFKYSGEDLGLDDVFPSVGPYGSRPVGVKSTGADGWQANFRLPPGLGSGWHNVRMKVRNSLWSNTARIGVDVPPPDTMTTVVPVDLELAIEIVTDGLTWERNRVRIGLGSAISLWVKGIPLGVTKWYVTVQLNGADLPTVFLSEPDERGTRQINALLPSGMAAGPYAVRVCCGCAVSPAVAVELVA